MDLDPYINQALRIKVGHGHELQVWDWGNKHAAKTFIVLHGGPGSQTKAKHSTVFNPKTQRVIFFDQRGSGLSTPFGSLQHNTTQDMISDITVIADYFKLEQFILHGNSWGSTLALAYALAHPERVSALLIGGVFTGSQAESDWIDNGALKTFYPEVWQAYLDRTPKEHQSNPSAYHFDKALNGTAKEQKLSAYAYDCLESGVIKLDDRSQAETFEDYNPAGMRIEMHYLANGCFMPNRHILDNAHRLTMPVYIVQGRYDMVCPPLTAYELHAALPNSQLYWALSGHAFEHENQNIFATIIANL